MNSDKSKLIARTSIYATDPDICKAALHMTMCFDYQTKGIESGDFRIELSEPRTFMNNDLDQIQSPILSTIGISGYAIALSNSRFIEELADDFAHKAYMLNGHHQGWVDVEKLVSDAFSDCIATSMNNLFHTKMVSDPKLLKNLAMYEFQCQEDEITIKSRKPFIDDICIVNTGSYPNKKLVRMDYTPLSAPVAHYIIKKEEW